VKETRRSVHGIVMLCLILIDRTIPSIMRVTPHQLPHGLIAQEPLYTLALPWLHVIVQDVQGPCLSNLSVCLITKAIKSLLVCFKSVGHKLSTVGFLWSTFLTLV
jgi:hypothetical protein